MMSEKEAWRHLYKCLGNIKQFGNSDYYHYKFIIKKHEIWRWGLCFSIEDLYDFKEINKKTRDKMQKAIKRKREKDKIYSNYIWNTDKKGMEQRRRFCKYQIEKLNKEK